MKESELVRELTAFGLSNNQAKAYVCILRSKRSSISSIAEDTHIHPQDVYKILPKLEKMGLITKTTERPLFITNIPSAKALTRIITLEQQKATDKINRMKTVRAVAQAIENNFVENEIDLQSDNATYIVTDNSVNNSLDEAFEKARIQFDGVLNFELMRRRSPHLCNHCKALATHKVKTRILIEDLHILEANKKLLKQIIPSKGDFTLKQGGNIRVKPYLIFDNKELFITTQRKTTGLFPCMLKTDSRNIIEIYQQNFETAWDNGKPIVLDPEEWVEPNGQSLQKRVTLIE
ncbi:MAG: hypothetical protein NWE92_11750 [Candidatus Bathyarchaeota archaeon]|nr:hypothetical protein [Candidatus Bathyarchaeota archaeon]